MQIVSEKLKHKDGKVSAAILAHYRELSDTLVECLIDSDDLPNFASLLQRSISFPLSFADLDVAAKQNASNCIKAIYHLSVVYPECVSTNKAATLLPYLTTISKVRSYLDANPSSTCDG